MYAYILALHASGKTRSEERSESLQTGLDNEFLAGEITQAQYDEACQKLEAITDYE